MWKVCVTGVFCEACVVNGSCGVNVLCTCVCECEEVFTVANLYAHCGRSVSYTHLTLPTNHRV